MAIVLPQGKFNNSTLAYIREWILKHARLLAVVGLHPNTFKPHTGTKTSVLFFQKHSGEELTRISNVENSVRFKCPDYRGLLKKVIDAHREKDDLAEDDLPPEVVELLHELFDVGQEQNGQDIGANRTESLMIPRNSIWRH